MSEIYITSDEHYGHENMIRYCNRPFRDTDHLREELIARHNAKVQNETDLTIHCGDMFWNTVSPQEAKEILARLNGHHAYIWGNHEKPLLANPHLLKAFDFVENVHEFDWGKQHIVLCHYAMRVWNQSHRGSWMLYGHSHGELEELGLSFDIGVDQHDFTPWSLEEIAKKMATKQSNHVIPEEKRWPGKAL